MKQALVYTFVDQPVLLIDLDFKQTTVIDGISHWTIELIKTGSIDVKGFKLEKDNTIGYSFYTDRVFVSNVSLMGPDTGLISEVIEYDGEYPNTKQVLEALKNMELAEDQLTFEEETDSLDQNVNDPNWINPLKFIYDDANVADIILETFQVNVDEEHPLYGKTLATIVDGSTLGTGTDLMFKMSSKNPGNFNAYIIGNSYLPESTVEITQAIKNVTMRYETYFIPKGNSLEDFTKTVQSYLLSSEASLFSSFWTNSHWL
jgi:hypothetical protein